MRTLVLFAAAAVLLHGGAEVRLQRSLDGKARSVRLPAGVFVLDGPVRVPEGKQVRGAKTTLRASARFRGRALVLCGSGSVIEALTIDGNRDAYPERPGIAPYDRTFASFYSWNGILIERARDVTIRRVQFRRIAGFAVLASASEDVLVERVTVSDSGSLNPLRRNNTTGGILFEEGSRRFTVRDSRFVRVRGNGIWTHSLYPSPRNGPGTMERNHFEEIGRDALQAGHATAVRIARNTGVRIGYPDAVVDYEGGGTPVAIDTAGDVDASAYTDNEFADINGKCIDLDGFHHGEVRSNVCRDSAHYGIVFNNTNPDMQSVAVSVTDNVIDGAKYGGIFVIGSGHTISGNRLTRLNTARCNQTAGCLYDAGQPDLLRSGIYLGAKAERPAPSRDNVITDNVVSGFGMREHCIMPAPGVRLQDQKEIARNECTNQTTP